MGDFKIDITSELDRFKKHLELLDNNHIIVSGIFGIGKTYFQKAFFEKYSEQYEVIYLTPVNYIVSRNEDIFEYIKHDITFELLAKDIDLESDEFSKLLTAQMFILNNLYFIGKTIIDSTLKLNKTTKNISESLTKLITKFEEYHKSDQVNEQSELEVFLQEFGKKIGVIYEHDRITEIISSIIQYTKQSGKEVVLVIDDLDRIDPEHIFRLFNVFACHFDSDNSGLNKFGLDKVIFVCDIENIRNIFHSKYGTNVDFTGYVDKFYSREIFHYDNKSLIDKSLTTILSSIETKPEYKRIFNLQDKELGITKELRDILTMLVYSNAINLRTLIKLVNKLYNIPNYGINFNDRFVTTPNFHLSIVLIFDFLYSLFGTQKSLELALLKCEQYNLSMQIDNYDLWRVGFLLIVLDFETHKFKDGEYIYNNQELDVSLQYEIKRYGGWNEQISGQVKKATSIQNKERTIDQIPYFKLLRLTYEAFNKYRTNRLTS